MMGPRQALYRWALALLERAQILLLTARAKHEVATWAYDDPCETAGEYRGHRFSCHIFVCTGCRLPAGHCDCDYNERQGRAQANGTKPRTTSTR